MQWKNATTADQKKDGNGTKQPGSKQGAPAAPAAGDAPGSPTHRKPNQRQRQQQQRQRDGAAAGGGAGSAGAIATASPVPPESQELANAKARVRGLEGILDIDIKMFGESHRTTDAARTSLAIAVSEVERLTPAAAADSIGAMQVMQQDYDRYLGLLGPDDPIVTGLRARMDAANELRSETAVALEKAKKRLDLLLKHRPDETELIQTARATLDDAKIANGSKESDCYQSAETALNQAQATIDSMHLEIEAAVVELDAVQAKQKKLAADMVTALEVRDAAKKRLADRVVSISTLAPGILQPADVTTMSEKMQALASISQALHGKATKDGAVTLVDYQSVMDGIRDLLGAAPPTVFTESTTAEPQEGAPAAVAGVSGAAASPAAAATLSVAAVQARHDAREVQRLILEKKSQTERRADQLQLSEAYEAAAAAAGKITNLNQAWAACTHGLADDDLAGLSTDQIMATQWEYPTASPMAAAAAAIESRRSAAAAAQIEAATAHLAAGG